MSAPGARWWRRAAVAVAKRPDLWGTALAEGRCFLPRHWWRRWPPLPLPAESWIEFRMETAYGDGKARPSEDDVVVWLEWCRGARALLPKPPRA